jgi:hypothetical protein
LLGRLPFGIPLPSAPAGRRRPLIFLAEEARVARGPSRARRFVCVSNDGGPLTGPVSLATFTKYAGAPPNFLNSIPDYLAALSYCRNVKRISTSHCPGHVMRPLYLLTRLPSRPTKAKSRTGLSKVPAHLAPRYQHNQWKDPQSQRQSGKSQGRAAIIFSG